MRALGNCLVSNNTVLTFEDPKFKELSNDLIEIFELFNDWRRLFSELESIDNAVKLENLVEQDKENDYELRRFFSKMQDESTLALFLIYTDVELLTYQIEADMPFHKLESFKQIKYLMVLLKNND